MNWRRTLGLTALSGLLIAVLLPALSQASRSGGNGKIAFSTPLNGVNQLFTVNPDGTGLRQITHGSTEAGQFGLSWSPDGTHLLFSVTIQGKDQIATSLADGSDVTVISPPCTGSCLGDDGAAYSPDGKKIVFERNLAVNSSTQLPAVFTMNADGSGLTQLTQKPMPTTAGDIEPRWSPNGARIAVHRFYPPSYHGVIELLNADGSDVRRLTRLRIDATNPRWSPNGRQLLFNTDNFNTYQPASGKSANLFTIRPDGTHRTALTHFSGGNLQAFAQDWSPDGRHILYSRFRDGLGYFYITDSHGKHTRRLTSVRLTDYSDSRAAWGR
jgi:Tol biopolymer transport system component